MGNCATNCSNCMGKDGEHAEFNMDSQSNKLGITTDVVGAQGLGDNQNNTQGRDYNRLL